jgi:hypothetical protein
MLEFLLVFVGKACDFLFDKVLGTAYEIIVVPVRVYCKKNERRQFLFESTLLIEDRLNFGVVVSSLKEPYDLKQGNDFNEFFTHFDLDNVPFELNLVLHPNYEKIETISSKELRKEFERAPISSVTFSFKCHTLLREVQNNCNLIKGQLDEIKEKINTAAKENYDYTHNRLIFKLSKEIKFKPIQNFRDVDYVEIVIGQGKIKISRKECVVSVNTWLLNDHTQTSLFKLLTFIGG